MMRFLSVLILMFVMITSCEEIVEVEDISNKSVEILAPVDASTLTATAVNFSWDTVIDSEQYKLQIALPNFEMADQILLDTTIVVTNFNHTLEIGSYEWRVRAENSEYITSYSTQSFTIEE